MIVAGPRRRSSRSRRRLIGEVGGEDSRSRACSACRCASCGRPMRTRSRRRSPGSAGNSPGRRAPGRSPCDESGATARRSCSSACSRCRPRAARRAAVRGRGRPHDPRGEPPHRNDDVDGKRIDVVGLDSIPIGPTWRASTSWARTTTAATRCAAALRRLAPHDGGPRRRVALAAPRRSRSASRPATGAAARTRSSAGCSTCSGRFRRCSRRPPQHRPHPQGWTSGRSRSARARS